MRSHADWTACPTRPCNPSMGVTLRFATDASGSRHENVASPSRWTVHARQSVLPHPNFVPVMPRWSRSTQSTGVSEDASTETLLPLSWNRVMEFLAGGYWTQRACLLRARL